MGGYTPIQIMPIRPENRQQQQFAADRRCWRPPGPEARTMVAAAATGAAWGWIPGIPGRHRGRRAEAQRRARAVRPWRTASAERKHALRSTSPSCRAAAAAAAAAGRSRRRGSGRHCSRRGAPRTAVDGSARWSAWKVRCAVCRAQQRRRAQQRSSRCLVRGRAGRAKVLCALVSGNPRARAILGRCGQGQTCKRVCCPQRALRSRARRSRYRERGAFWAGLHRQA